MKEQKIEYKLRLPQKGLYLIILERINSCRERNKEIITFPKVFSKLGGSFQLHKKEVWEILFFLRDLEFIKIVFGHGIIINYELTKNGL
jgi:hypothetical protein